jgi:hypothetical protein
MLEASKFYTSNYTRVIVTKPAWYRHKKQPQRPIEQTRRSRNKNT